MTTRLDLIADHRGEPMSDKKIQVELTEDDARAYVQRVVDSDVMERVNDAILAALPPECPEGTVARVHWGHGEDASVAFAEWRDGEWRHANGIGTYEFRHEVTKVEPLRVLADDEIAVKLPNPSDFNAIDVRIAARRLREDAAYTYIPAWMETHLADALEAEATS